MARILRLPAVIDRTGNSRSPIYADIQLGLFPRPIKIGARAAGWPEHEIEQIIVARIGGADNSTIRNLVARLHEARTAAAAAAAK
jgi:prophage regulatory protein